MPSFYTFPKFWPAVRARNFVKELGQTPTTYAENMKILAERAGVHVGQMCHVNPVTFAERNFPMGGWELGGLLNKDIRRLFQEEASALLYPAGSSSWDYHRRLPIRPYVDQTLAIKEARARIRGGGCKWVWTRGTRPPKPQPARYPSVTRGERRARRDPYDSLF
jgi:hypothetical protein